MSLNNLDFTTQLAHLIMQFHTAVLTETTFATALDSLINDWTEDGITLPQLAANLSNVLANWNAGSLEFRSWLNGTATGGYNSNGTVSNGISPNGGYYPLRDGLGSIYYVASPAKMVGALTKGDPGLNAAVDINCSWQFGLAANEILGGVVQAHDTAYDATMCKGYIKGVTAGTAILHVKKNMPYATTDPTTVTDWATFTWTAAAHTATFAFIGTNSVVAGDVIEFVAPATPVANFADGRVVIGG